MVVVSLGPGRFYGSSLPRPRFVKHKEQRVDPPPSVMDPLLSWAHDAHWSMGGLNFTRHRLQGRIEGNVDKLRAQRQHHHHKNNYTNSSSPKHKKPETTSSKRINKVETPSPPPAPVAIKRRRVVGLVDEEDEEIGVKRRRRRLVRKLGDDFERVARQTTSTSTSSKRNHAADDDDDDDDVETINKRGKKLVKIGNRRSSPRLANKKKITRSN